MNFRGTPGDGESQISHGKWKETEIRRIRLCWDEFLINPAPRKTRRRIFTTGAGPLPDTKGVAGQVRQVVGSDMIQLIFCQKRRG